MSSNNTSYSTTWLPFKQTNRPYQITISMRILARDMAKETRTTGVVRVFAYTPRTFNYNRAPLEASDHVGTHVRKRVAPACLSRLEIDRGRAFCARLERETGSGLQAHAAGINYTIGGELRWEVEVNVLFREISFDRWNFIGRMVLFFSNIGLAFLGRIAGGEFFGYYGV